MTEFEGWQVAEASLFPDPGFRNTEALGEFVRGQQLTRGIAEPFSSRCAHSALAKAAYLLVIPSLSSGPKLPTKSSARLPDFVIEFQAQDSSRMLKKDRLSLDYDLN